MIALGIGSAGALPAPGLRRPVLDSAGNGNVGFGSGRLARMGFRPATRTLRARPGGWPGGVFERPGCAGSCGCCAGCLRRTAAGLGSQVDPGWPGIRGCCPGNYRLSCEARLAWDYGLSWLHWEPGLSRLPADSDRRVRLHWLLAGADWDRAPGRRLVRAACSGTRHRLPPAPMMRSLGLRAAMFNGSGACALGLLGSPVARRWRCAGSQAVRH